MDGGPFKEVFAIAAMLIAVAFAALLIGHPQGTATVIGAAGGTFNTLLQTVELANGGGFAGYSGIPSQYGSFTQ